MDNEANMSFEKYKKLINEAFEQRDQISPRTDDDELREVVRYIIDEIDRGELRVAEKV
ncbi:MAG TPA: 2,3,4,5-tetrahydropyridine-2,6-dicarboxylate N-succinyltransferase, partial [Idiomarina baltica]|nr:2,3,4,5-tetrahydropyridine-2,6-dicarboxylate N-succinyltransferase [Idiomarina baltica]